MSRKFKSVPIAAKGNLKVTIAMIVLNEEEHVGLNLEQHYDHADKIIIVEGADRLYPSDRVTSDGLSIDNTADIIRNFPDPQGKITFVRHGWTKMGGEQAKCELRNRYADLIKDGLVCVIDADEFYSHKDFISIIDAAKRNHGIHCWQYPFYHFWKNTSQFVIGGYYDISHDRFWRWIEGTRYIRNHNWPEVRGRYLNQLGRAVRSRKIEKTDNGYVIAGPVSYHLGFMRKAENIRAKNDYYINRGEIQTRPTTIASREAWFEEGLPDYLEVLKFGGKLPECLERLS